MSLSSLLKDTKPHHVYTVNNVGHETVSHVSMSSWLDKKQMKVGYSEFTTSPWPMGEFACLCDEI